MTNRLETITPQGDERMNPNKMLSAHVRIIKLFARVRYNKNEKNPRKGGTEIDNKSGLAASRSGFTRCSHCPR
jgi:hypothetical protein